MKAFDCMRRVHTLRTLSRAGLWGDKKGEAAAAHGCRLSFGFICRPYERRSSSLLRFALKTSKIADQTIFYPTNR
jgi:hypothetical protein